MTQRSQEDRRHRPLWGLLQRHGDLRRAAVQQRDQGLQEDEEGGGTVSNAKPLSLTNLPVASLYPVRLAGNGQ